MRVTIALLFAFLISGCATTPRAPLGTPSGRPEISISGVTTKQVIDRVVSGALNKGKSVLRVSEYEVVVAKKVDNSLATLLYGSRYDSTPEARTTLNVVQVKDVVKVYARAEMITNPGSAFERSTDLTEAAGQELQKNLEEVRNDLSQNSGTGSTKPSSVSNVSTDPQASVATASNEATASGQLSYEAEKLAIDSGCKSESGIRPAASLIQKNSNIEIYGIPCARQHMMVRCELRKCNLMK